MKSTCDYYKAKFVAMQKQIKAMAEVNGKTAHGIPAIANANSFVPGTGLTPAKRYQSDTIPNAVGVLLASQTNENATTAISDSLSHSADSSSQSLQEDLNMQ